MGVAACCVILFPMSPVLFWYVVKMIIHSFPSFHKNDFRFLSAFVALSSTGTHMCSRLLLSEHATVKHASATFVTVPTSVFHKEIYSSSQLRIRDRK
jgi:hypothetical protein